MTGPTSTDYISRWVFGAASFLSFEDLHLLALLVGEFYYPGQVMIACVMFMFLLMLFMVLLLIPLRMQCMCFVVASLVDCFGLCLLLLGVLHVCDSSFSLSVFVLVGYGVYGVSAYGSSYGSGCLVCTLFWFMFLFRRGVACFLLIISFIIFCFAYCVDDISDLFFCSCMFPTIVFVIANE